MSGTSAFLRLKRCAKSVKETPVSLPSKSKKIEFVNLMRGDGKSLSTNESALGKIFFDIFLQRVDLVHRSFFILGR